MKPWNNLISSLLGMQGTFINVCGLKGVPKEDYLCVIYPSTSNKIKIFTNVCNKLRDNYIDRVQ